MAGHRKRGGWAVAAVALLALTACGQSVAGDPTVQGADVPPVTLESLGELRTMDPCGLVGEGALAEFGDARQLARKSLDDCTLAVALGRENVVLRFGEVRPVGWTPNGGRTLATLPGDLRLVRSATSENGSTCTQHVMLSGGSGVDVYGAAQRSTTELTVEDVCAVGRAAAESVADTLASGEVPRWNPPHNSLVRQSACGLLPTEEVAGLVGASARDVTLYPAEHQCTWGRAAGETSNAQLDFTVGPPLAEAEIERVAGRDTTLERTDTSSVRICTISTEHIEFAQAVDGERERAVIRVLHPVPEGKDPCETGKKLAASAWPKLPAP